ncbi:hypothetical protein J2I46_02620 [Fibrella sp. HMF5405]|uniref:Glycosyltransferase RgtA/B/C/D-like domain-containing protein n=1 Tax=Fibrella forsythiae TaxID=2817061 RepID=A0ABS3JBV7_9BACT|nr:hypothetical protein [Fibrella forsythiae]
MLGIVVTVLGVGIIQDFHGPLLDGGDTDQYAYTSYYFARNLTLWPIPLLDLHNNQTFYPYGTHHVFLPWGFERDYFYALLDRWPNAEYKPFLQLYYLFSLLVGAIGTFLLLHKRFGSTRACITGLIVSLFTFYNLYKYPVHYNMAVVHWTVLCMLATFLLVYDAYHSYPISLTRWLVWAWLHLAILGLELGYVAGYALAFSTLCAPFILYQLWHKNRLDNTPNLTLLTYWITTNYRKHKVTVILLILLCFITIWLYVPLSAQISLDALSYDFPDVGEMRAWSHPLRLFIPSLSGLDDFAIRYETIFHDPPAESYGQTSPGLYLTILGLAGLWQQRNKVGLWGPVALLLVLCLLYHPVSFPTMKIFPWFSFNRHGGRSSMVYPVLLCMLALPIQTPKKRLSQLALLSIFALMLAEWFHGYTFRRSYATTSASPGLFTYLQTVRDTPGKAVFDWPFCIQGADAVANSDGLCSFYEAQNSVNTLRRFYHKAVVGQYVGRLHPDLVRPFIRDQWPRLLAPDYVFTEADWAFVDHFLRDNEFAGINLYTDLLTPEQAQAFILHYGPVIATCKHPTAGHLAFLRLRK